MCRLGAASLHGLWPAAGLVLLLAACAHAKVPLDGADVLWSASENGVKLEVDETFGYSLYVDDALWLHGSEYFFNCNGTRYQFGGAGHANMHVRSTGKSANALALYWTGGSSSTIIYATTFELKPGEGFRFQQTFETPCNHTNVAPLPGNSSSSSAYGEFRSAATTSSGFPVWEAGADTFLGSKLGYVTWSGRFMHDHSNHGVGLSEYKGGQEGGPIVFFDWQQNKGVNADAFVLSPMDRFMSNSMAINNVCTRLPTCNIMEKVDFIGNDLINFKTDTLGECCAACEATDGCTCFSWADPKTAPTNPNMCWLKYSTAGKAPSPHTSGISCTGDTRRILTVGIHGHITSVPAGFQTSAILVFPRRCGINCAMETWGSVLRAMYNTERLTADLTVSRLGYWTDNGGYYYGRNPMTQNIAREVFGNLSQQGVPVRYLQLDPYWYQDTWNPKPELFPDGLSGLKMATGVPLLLYSNFWTIHSPKAYNYQYDFEYSYNIDGMDDAVRRRRGLEDLRVITRVKSKDAFRFYSNIATQYVKSGIMNGFEVDFMDFNLLTFPEMITSVNEPETWAKEMGNALNRLKQPMQWCMGLPSWMLLSLEIPCLTNARASEDNFPSNEHRWKIGYTSLFLNALHIAPFMDVIWTRADQPGNPYGQPRDNILLQAAIAALSCGPIGIGDGVGLTNKTLVQLLANGDGYLLHPTRPATPLDRMYYPAAPELPSGEIWSTYVSFDGASGLGTFRIVLVVDQADELAVSLDELPSGPLALSAGQRQQRPSLENMTGYFGFRHSRLSAADCADGHPTSACVVPLESDQLMVRTGKAQGNEHNFDIFYVVPQHNTSCGIFALLGDLSFVGLSPNRFQNLTMSSSDYKLNLRISGGPENITLATVEHNTLRHHQFTLPKSGVFNFEINWSS
eukprot:m.46559 g.46559  ORF g.46559 m.46559 type:complete len:910 (-) comp6309_c0_seq1:137-2866(-)